MKIVTEVILEYLGSNRRLVVPALGAFMVKDTGDLVFSDLLRNDDGVLSSLLLGRGMNDMEVAVMIDRFVFEVRHELDQYGYCRMGELGTLRIEPDTKVLRLYPPVKSEEPLSVVDTPYVPEPIVEPIVEPISTGAEAEAEAESVPDVQPVQCEEPAEVAEVAETAVVEQSVAVADEPSESETPIAQPKEETPQSEVAQTQPKLEMPHPKRAKRRMKFDLVMVVAIAVIVAALALIALGLYNANSSEKANDAADNAAMDNARLITEPGNNNVFVELFPND